MKANLYILILVLGVFISCKKSETKTSYSIKYKLFGKYERDTSITKDGLKMLNLSNNNYCWTRVIDGLDSNFCQGTFVQTSDTSLVWGDNFVINYTYQTLDTIPNGIIIQLDASPPVGPLFGYYK